MKQTNNQRVNHSVKSQKALANIKRQIIRRQKRSDHNELIKQDSHNYFSEVKDENGLLLRTKYYLSRNSRVYISTTILILVVLAVFVYLMLSSSGNYLSAWYLSIMGGVFLLYLLSFPIKIIVKDKLVELHGVLDVTPIPIKNIKRIYKIDRYRLKQIIPLAGSYGFGGFFGYYFDYKKLKVLTLFCRALESLVVIEDVFHDKYILNVPQRERFIKQIRRLIP